MECKVFQVLTNLHKQKYETLTNFYRIKQTQNKVISRSTKWQTKMENFRKVLPSYTNINIKVFTKLQKLVLVENDWFFFSFSLVLVVNGWFFLHCFILALLILTIFFHYYFYRLYLLHVYPHSIHLCTTYT